MPNSLLLHRTAAAQCGDIYIYVDQKLRQLPVTLINKRTQKQLLVKKCSWFCQLLLGSVSSKQRFGATDIKALGASQLSSLGQAMLQLLDKSVLLLYFIQIIAGNPSSKREGMPTQRHEEKRVEECARAWERERERECFGSSFYMFFPPPGPALCKLGQPGVLFVLPEVLTQVLGPSLDLPLSYFRGLFPSLSFIHCHFGLLFPILTT